MFFLHCTFRAADIVNEIVECAIDGCAMTRITLYEHIPVVCSAHLALQVCVFFGQYS